MKKRMIAGMVSLVCCIFQQATSFAQYLPKSIAPYHIDICDDKTTNLIFPSAIKSVDRGSASVLAQKAQGVESILQVKAGETNFKETNLTVITADGHFYSFAVTYSQQPATLNFSFVGDSSEKAIIKDQPLAESEYRAIASSIKSKRHSLHKSVSEGKVKLSLNNLFIKDDLLWVEIGIANGSPITYVPAYTRFFVHDTKTAKRTAVQEAEMIALYHTGSTEVRKDNTRLYVFAFKPFAVQRGKELIIQMGEAESGRTLTLLLRHRAMQKIKSL